MDYKILIMIAAFTTLENRGTGPPQPFSWLSWGQLTPLTTWWICHWAQAYAMLPKRPLTRNSSFDHTYMALHISVPE